MSDNTNKVITHHVVPAEPWDSTITMSPNPSWPVERQLHWYQVASHVMLLNCSDLVRRKAAQAADREAL